jgi:SAM-dependent methyltransferase
VHDSSFSKMQVFVEQYLGAHRTDELSVLDVGSQLVSEDQTTYRSLFDAPSWRYVGMDVEPGINVAVAVADPYRWTEVEADSFDVVVSGQALEHIKFFWLTAFEIGRVLKPGGITMLVAPSGGFEHRFPVDCWRYYRDGMTALAELIGFEVLDAGTEWAATPWADSYLVMRKPLWSDDRRAEFDRRRGLQYAAVFGGEPTVAAVAPAAAVASAPFLEARAGLVTEQIEATERATAAIAASAAAAGVSPAPSSSGWRRVLRRVIPARALAVYRAARYGRSHLPGQ